jgi:hypothetical protein
LKAFPDIVNCKDDLDKFIDIVNWTWQWEENIWLDKIKKYKKRTMVWFA